MDRAEPRRNKFVTNSLGLSRPTALDSDRLPVAASHSISVGGRNVSPYQVGDSVRVRVTRSASRRSVRPKRILRCRQGHERRGAPGRHRRSVQPGADREDALHGHRRDWPLHHRRPAAGHLQADLHARRVSRRSFATASSWPATRRSPINVELRVGALEESVTVSGQTPLVDVQNAQRTQVVERDVIDALPTTRNMQSVGSIVPGVKLSRPDVGGSQGMEQTYMRTHGADDRHTSMQVDGMTVNSSMGDGNIQAYNDDALAQQVVFQTSALPAEVAAGGVRVNMIPKDGGNTVKGGGFFGGTASGWQANNLTDDLRAKGFKFRNFVDHVQDFNFNMGGPIMKDRLWFFSTVRHVSVDEGRRQLVLSGRLPGHPGHPAQGGRSVHPAPVRAGRADPADVSGQLEDEDQLVSRADLEAQGSGAAVRLQPDHRIRHPRSASRALLRGTGRRSPRR